MSALRGAALVTGASSGIGRAVAEVLAARGMRVALCGRDPSRLAEAAAAIGAGSRPVTIAADLSDAAAVTALAARAVAELGQVDVLVHAAGTLRLGRLADAIAEDLDDLYAVNVRAPVVLTRALLPSLGAARGHVVFVNSTAGLVPGAGNGLYAATKHALAAIARSLRDEVNRDGVRVLSIFPGRTATPMQEAVCAFEGVAFRPEELLQPRDVAEAIAGALALPATAEVTDIMIRPATKPPKEGKP